MVNKCLASLEIKGWICHLIVADTPFDIYGDDADNYLNMDADSILLTLNVLVA